VAGRTSSSLGRDKNNKFWESSSLSMLEFGQTYGNADNTYWATLDQNFRHKGDEVLYTL